MWSTAELFSWFLSSCGEFDERRLCGLLRGFLDGTLLRGVRAQKLQNAVLKCCADHDVKQISAPWGNHSASIGRTFEAFEEERRFR